MARINIRIKANRDGSPYTGGLTLGAQGEDGIPRKLEPGEVVSVDASILDELPSVAEMTEQVSNPPTRPLTFPNQNMAAATSPRYKALDENTTKIKDEAEAFLKKFQKEHLAALRKAEPPKVEAPKGEGSKAQVK